MKIPMITTQAAKLIEMVMAFCFVDTGRNSGSIPGLYGLKANNVSGNSAHRMVDMRIYALKIWVSLGKVCGVVNLPCSNNKG